MFRKEEFRYDAGSDTYLCPGEQRLEPRYHSVVKGHALVNYCNHDACRTCPLRPCCTPNSYRRISRWANEAVLDRMAERLAARPELLQVRRETVEHPFGSTRSMKQLIETIEELRLRGIGFRSLTEALDTTTAQGRLVFHMFGALAEFERSLIRERTQAGLAAARRAGRTGGRPPKLTDDDIKAAKAMLANPDIAVTQIAHRLGVSPATLYRYIPAARTANTPGV